MSHTLAEQLTSLFWYFSLPQKTICTSDPPSNYSTRIDTLSQTLCVQTNLIF